MFEDGAAELERSPAPDAPLDQWLRTVCALEG
jgi:hypothetical protein